MPEATLKSSLRSSLRRNHLSADHYSPRSPPSIGDATTSMHLGKRLHQKTTPNRDEEASKRQKINNIQRAYTQKIAVRDHIPNHSRKQPEADRGAGLTGASRGTSAVQPPATGTIIAPHAQLTNGQSHILAPDSTSTLDISGVAEKERRTLRSHDGGSRSKSELAQYFPNFDDIVSNEPKEVELLTGGTRLYISEEPPKSPTSTKTFVLPSPLRRNSSNLFTPISPRTRPQTIPTPITCQKLDLGDVFLKGPSKNASDPLPDSIFEKAHRRAERQEKQLRNIEKERAMHEKVQLERLLEGLKGPDWLRVMGISGIVEGERKKWDDRRLYFIREVKSLLEKFRLWKEEERRRKADKEQSVQDEDEREAEDEDEDEEDEETEDEEDEDEEETDTSSATTDDVDALAALQLHNESLSATSRPHKSRSKTKSKTHPTAKAATSTLTSRLKKPSNPFNSTNPSKHRLNSAHSNDKLAPTKKLKLHPTALPPHDAAVQPIKSFFKKPHQRAAALDKTRRSAGRTRLAFGVPLPDPPEKPFELPDGFVSKQAMRASARGSRRLRGEVLGKGGG